MNREQQNPRTDRYAACYQHCIKTTGKKSDKGGNEEWNP